MTIIENRLTPKENKRLMRLSLIKDYKDFKYFFIETTDQCNLNCSYCYYSKRSNNQSNIDPVETIDFLVDKFKKIFITFLGGEPFLNSKFMERMMERYLTNSNIIFSTNTNGTVIDKLNPTYLPSFLLHYISIEGKKDYHDIVRGNGVFDKILKNISYIRQRSSSVLIARMTITDPNQLLVIPELLGSFDAVYWQINNNINQLKHNFLSIYKERLYELFLFWKDNIDKNIDFAIIPFVGMADIILKGGIEKPDLICGAGTNHVCISTQGHIYPCPETRHRNEDLEKLGNIDTFIFNPYPLKADCKRCNILKYCGGRCVMVHDLLYCHTTHYLYDIINKYLQDQNEEFLRLISEKINYQRNIAYTTEIIP